MFLKIPIYQGNYDLIQKYSKKSQIKKLFEELELPTSSGVEEIEDEN